MNLKLTEIFAELRKYDTPTICNALEIIKGGRQNSGFTQGLSPVVCASKQLLPMVGYAKTAKISGRQPTRQSPEEVLQMRLDYHTYMGTGPYPAVAVLADLDYPQPIASFIGEINIAVHKALGLEGILTSGLIRDLDCLADFPCVASGIGVSHAFVTVKELATEVELMGMQVQPAQIVHADQHGAVVIENEAQLLALPAAIKQLLAKESIIIKAAQQPGTTSEQINQAYLKFIKH